MKLTLADSGILKDSISIISELVNEGTFSINKNGMELIAMDPANVAMVIFKLLSSAFVEFDVKEPIKLGINLNDLKQVFRRVKANDMLTLEISGDNRLKIILKSDTTRQFSLPIIDIQDSEQKVPDLTFKATVVTSSARFADAIGDVDIIADSVQMELDSEKLILSAKGDSNSAMIEIKQDNDTKIILEEDRKFKAKYSIEYLKKMINRIADTVSIQFDTDYPLKLEYKVVDKLMMSFILAPRVEND